MLRRLARLLPAALLLGLAALSLTPPVRAQTPASPGARFAFADTTLLRDTLDLHFDGLFELADSLRITPDSLRAYAIRYDMPLSRLVFLADSLGTRVDSVGTVFTREQFNPLARRTDRLTSFRYESTYTPARQSAAWGNSVTADLVRGPATLHNATVVRVDRIIGGSTIGFTRSNNSSTEAGWRFSPNLAAGGRVNYTRTENDQLGSKRVTQNTDLQGSLRGRYSLAPHLGGDLNFFGGPFNEPSNSLSSGSKQGIGTQVDGRLQYTGTSWITMDNHGTGSVRFGHATIPARARFPTQDLRYNLQGNVSMWPSSPASVTVNYALNGDHTERASTSTQYVTGPGGPTDVDTLVTDRLLSEPSGTASVDAATQFSAGGRGTLTLSANLSRSTRLLASERTSGLVLDRSLSRDAGFSVDGQLNMWGWSLDAQFNEDHPSDENPRTGAVSVPVDGGFDAVTVDYRERSRILNRSISAQATRALTSHLTFRARGNVSLTQNRYAVVDNAYLAQTDGVPVKPGDAQDNYRQSYRIEGTYMPSGRFSTTVGLQVSRVTQLLLDALRSISNKEDRVYTTDWVWTYRLFAGLTANQRNQINATYTNNIYHPQNNRLVLSYSTVTTLNATLTRHLTADLTHNTIYGPNGGYAVAVDGLQYFSVSDATRDYTLSGRLNYTPTPAFTLTLFPTYRANEREDRTGGINVTTSTRAQLDMSAGASLNTNVTERARLTGSIYRNFSSRRDVTYRAGVPNYQPSSAYDYWSGSLQLSWQL